MTDSIRSYPCINLAILFSAVPKSFETGIGSFVGTSLSAVSFLLGESIVVSKGLGSTESLSDNSSVSSVLAFESASKISAISEKRSAEIGTSSSESSIST